MNDVIIRNMERLIACSSDSERERIEPMTAWKWRKLYQIANHYGILPWIAAGVHAYEGDFFMQIPDDVLTPLMIECGDKSEENLQKFQLQVERSKGLLHHLTTRSLRAYAKDFIQTVKNVQE